MVISFDSVFMIRLKSWKTFANECSGNELVNILKFPSFRKAGKKNLEISTPVFLLMHEAARSETADTSEIRDLEEFPFGNRQPDFICNHQDAHLNTQSNIGAS